MHVLKTTTAAIFASAIALSAANAAETNGFHFSGPGIEIHVAPDGSTGGYTGHFRFGDGPDAFVGQAHFDTQGHADTQDHSDAAPPRSAAPDNNPTPADKPVTPKCPAGQELRDGWCHPSPQ